MIDPLDSLVTAVSARKVGENRFVVQSPPEGDFDRVFGGMIVAQGLNAALQSVPSDMALHSLHGYFLRPMAPGVEGTVHVEHVRDGKSFRTRRATTYVDGKPIYTFTCSFHREEDGDEYQIPLEQRVRPPGTPIVMDHPVPFDIDEVGPSKRRSDGTYASTRRAWFRTIRPLSNDPILHYTLVAFLSDMTGAAFRPHSLGVWGTHTDASLDHAVWFHKPVRPDQWLLFNLSAVVNFGGRSLVRGEMYDEEGNLLVSMAQEILIRPLLNPEPHYLLGASDTKVGT